MSFLKGFISLFDWMFPPKNYQELSDELDNKMQNLYDKMNWGKYNNPIKGKNADNKLLNDPKNQQAIEELLKKKTICCKNKVLGVKESKKVLKEYINNYKPKPFVPYAFYNADMDAIEAYFKNDSCYTKTLNNSIELHLSHDNDEIVGINILNIKKLIENE